MKAQLDHQGITIVPVKTKRQLRKFIMFPWKIYKKDPNWVPPVISEQKKFFNKKKNPYFRHSEAQLFLAYRMRQVIGRISAHTNTRHNQFHHDRTGFIGFFECINSLRGAAALFNAAELWLKEKGCDRIWGPENFSVNHNVGLLIQGFNKPPVFEMTYNPKYYIRLFEGSGFTKIQDLYAWKANLEEKPPKKIQDVALLARTMPGLVVRKIDTRHVQKEAEKIISIYNQAWDKNWGAVPLTPEEAKKTIHDLLKIANPDYLWIAEINGQAVGTAICLPNVNEQLIHLNGRLLSPRTIRMMIRHKNKFESYRVFIMGVLEEFRHFGIDSLMYHMLYEQALKDGVKWAEMSWILESNTVMNHIIASLGAERYKTYRIYERKIVE
ncbi:MAG: GNAT family N-acetyltransferase [Candidatus Neomarinimicrobiota bacterium]|nr:MAG: GNAT family N-acetyltransferase [Candidatus Neomarinimicrobiota bacterium]